MHNKRNQGDLRHQNLPESPSLPFQRSRDEGCHGYGGRKITPCPTPPPMTHIHIYTYIQTHTHTYKDTPFFPFLFFFSFSLRLSGHCWCHRWNYEFNIQVRDAYLGRSKPSGDVEEKEKKMEQEPRWLTDRHSVRTPLKFKREGNKKWEENSKFNLAEICFEDARFLLRFLLFRCN